MKLGFGSFQTFLENDEKSRVPVDDIHPALMYTHLGAVLWAMSAYSDPAGNMARAAISSPVDQPIEMMNIVALTDYMQDHPDHPFAGKINWAGLQRKVKMDLAIRQALDAYDNESNATDGRRIVNRLLFSAWAHNTLDPKYHPGSQALEGVLKELRKRIRKEHPGFSSRDYTKAFQRVAHQATRVSSDKNVYPVPFPAHRLDRHRELAADAPNADKY